MRNINHQASVAAPLSGSACDYPLSPYQHVNSLLIANCAIAPGPGQYHINTSAASGPSWTMSGKWADPAAGDKKDSADAVTPGPGEHHQEGWSSLGGPAFTISGRTAASGAQDDSPGPGIYTIVIWGIIAGVMYTCFARACSS